MKKIQRLRRHKRITKQMKGTEEKPRLVIFRSKKHMYAQLVNDKENRVLTGCSTLSKECDVSTLKKSVDSEKKETHKTMAAKAVGVLIAKKAVASGVTTICFDRAGYQYHGRVKALADAVREGGLKF